MSTQLADARLDRKKREVRIRLKAERTTPNQTVVSNRAASSAFPGMDFVVRDLDDIRPARPIPSKELEDINNRYWHLPYLPPGEQLEEAFEIGFRLRCWCDLFPSEEHWIRWRDANVTIPARSVTLCLLFWDKNEQIKNRLRKSRKEKKR